MRLHVIAGPSYWEQRALLKREGMASQTLPITANQPPTQDRRP